MFFGHIGQLQDGKFVDRRPSKPYIIVRKKESPEVGPNYYTFLMIDVYDLIAYSIWVVAGLMATVLVSIYVKNWFLAVCVFSIAISPITGTVAAYLRSWRHYPE